MDKRRSLLLAGVAVLLAGAGIATGSRLNAPPPAPDRAAFAQPTGTTVTVDPAITDPPPAATVTAAQVTALAHRPQSARGKTFALAGSVTSAEGPEAVAVVHPDGSAQPSATVLLRGNLIADVYQDDQFRATVTVTDATAKGLPVLSVTDIEVF